MRGFFYCTFLTAALSFTANADPIAVSTPAEPAASTATSSAVSASSAPVIGEPVIHAIHLTASAAGSKRYRAKLDKMLSETIINAVVVDIKDEEGFVYVKGVKPAERVGAYAGDIPDLPEWLASLKKRGIYTVARLVTFKDNKMPRHNPSLGVHNVNGDLWYDRHHLTWLDPYNPEAGTYDLLIALQSAKAGFDEVQFDYIRFPTDGSLKTMRFRHPYSATAGSEALVSLLHRAAQLLHPLGTKISIDVFGLTTSVNTGMGIGQRLFPMAEEVDYVCPMTYPSHYAKGEYGILNPNDEPYRLIHHAIRDALKTLGPGGAHKLRPYYQDFSLKGRGKRYGAAEVRAQIQAAADLGVPSWTLWNASCNYTLAALTHPFVPVQAPAPVEASTASVKTTVTPSSASTHP